MTVAMRPSSSIIARPRRIGALRIGLALTLALFTGVAASLPAHGDTGTRSDADYAKAQARVDYPVYAPTTTLRLPRTSFERVSCGNARDDFLSVDYGRQATLTSRWIGLQESPGPIGCVDGPDGFGPAATFTVNGAKAYVSGSCAGGRSTCSTSSPALAAKQAYTTITLPGSAAHPTPTFIEVYTQAMTLTQITAFVRGLVPVA